MRFLVVSETSRLGSAAWMRSWRATRTSSASVTAAGSDTRTRRVLAFAFLRREEVDRRSSTSTAATPRSSVRVPVRFASHATKASPRRWRRDPSVAPRCGAGHAHTSATASPRSSRSIAAELRRREIADVSHCWVSQLLDDLGAHRPSGPRERGPRYERSSPNSLWHIDIKGPFFIQLGKDHYLKTWIFGLVDDHSRYVLGLRIATVRQITPILAWLRDCIELCGRPLEVMSDNGIEFVHWMPGLLNRFDKTLRDLEIRQIKAQIN